MTVRWSPVEKLPRHGTTDGPYRYDATQGEAAVRWIAKYLRFPEGERVGQAFLLEPWQAKFVCALYGWRRRKDGRRRYKRALMGIPRGNGKSTLGAGLGIKGLIGDGVPTPFVLGAGTDRENAGIIFRAASSMVRRDRRLLRRLLPVDSTKRIVRRRGDGFYRVIAAEAQHAHGYHPTMEIIDDLQAQPSEEFIRVLDSAQVTVADPLSVKFMTAGYDRETIGWQEWQHAVRVREDPSLDEELLAVLYAVAGDADLDDPAVWREANPNLGISVREDFIRSKVRELAERPSKRAEILRLHFNVWTEAEFQSLIAPEAWDATAGQIAPADLRGRAVYVGVMATSVADVAAVVYVFPPEEDGGELAIEMEAFVPADNVARLEQRDGISYQAWIEEGWLRLTDSNVRDDKAIANSVVDRAKRDRLSIEDVAVNPRGAAGLIRELDEAGLEVTSVLPSFGQMSPAINELERMVLARELTHGANHLLSWMMRNLQARANADGDKKPDAEKSQGNIAGPVALLMALSRSIANDEDGGQWAAS